MSGVLIVESDAPGQAYVEDDEASSVARVEVGGPPGLSAYEIAVSEGFVGNADEWLASLRGDKGEKGDKGDPGAKGDKGDKGDPGAPGSGTGGFLMEASFASPSTQWVIEHNQGTFGVSVETFLPNGTPIEGNVLYPDANTVTIDWYYPTSGLARVFN